MKPSLSEKEQQWLLQTLKTRFEKHQSRHSGMDWASVEAKLVAQPEKLGSLYQMEITDGEPDVVGQERSTGAYLFVDCAAESPKGRRNLCYDREALDSRKEFKPENTVMDTVETMGIELLTEEEYRHLQCLGKFDSKTSSWIYTPPSIRKLGGALFADYRYDHVFIYHNGASSYYAARGFRGILRV